MHALLRHATGFHLASLVFAMNAQAQTTQRQYQLQKTGDAPPVLQAGGRSGAPAGRTRSAGARARGLAQSPRHLREARQVPRAHEAQPRAAVRRRRRSRRHRRQGHAIQEGRPGRRPSSSSSGWRAGPSRNIFGSVARRRRRRHAVAVRHAERERPGRDSQAPLLRRSGDPALRRRHGVECAGDARTHAAGRFRAAAGHGRRVDPRPADLRWRWAPSPSSPAPHDEKLARAKQLGAVVTINYKTTPDWDKAVLEATGGGVQQALEVGGKQTLRQDAGSLAPGGHVALIGGLSEFGGDIPAYALMGKNATASGLYVGSRADFEALNAFLEKHRFKPADRQGVRIRERRGGLRLHGLRHAVRQGGHPALTPAARAHPAAEPPSR